MYWEAHDTVIGYALGFQEHDFDIHRPLKLLDLPVQQLEGWNAPYEERVSFNILHMGCNLHLSNYYDLCENFQVLRRGRSSRGGHG
jgi:hypothetical protein